MTRNNMNRNRRAIGTTLGVHYGPEDRNWVRKGKVRVIRRKRHTEGATPRTPRTRQATDRREATGDDMMKGVLNQGFFYAAEKQYRVRSAWMVSGAYGSRPLSGRIAEVENPRRALRSEPDKIKVAIDVGLDERTLVEWARLDGKTYRDGRPFYGPPDVQCPEGHRVVVAYRHDYNQPHPAEYVSKAVVIEGPAPLPDDWQPG